MTNVREMRRAMQESRQLDDVAHIHPEKSQCFPIWDKVPCSVHSDVRIVGYQGERKVSLPRGDRAELVPSIAARERANGGNFSRASTVSDPVDLQRT
jgi:hypothetical protein